MTCHAFVGMLPKTGNVQWPKFHVKKAPFYAGYAAEVQYATRITITTPQSVKLAALRSFTMLRTGVGTPRFFSRDFFILFQRFNGVLLLSKVHWVPLAIPCIFVFLPLWRLFYSHSAVQHTAVQCSAEAAVPYSTVQVQCSWVRYNTEAAQLL